MTFHPILPQQAAASTSWINVVQFGADPTGAADSTTAIQTAINVAKNRGTNSGVSSLVTIGGTVYIPTGTYKITAALNGMVNGLTLQGDGMGSTVIVQNTSNTPILEVAGSQGGVIGMTLAYAAQESSANTSSIALQLGDDTVGSCFQWLFQDLQLQFAQTAIAINPSIATVAGVFSCTFQNIEVNCFSSYGIHLNANNGGGSANCTGCVFSNIYIDNINQGVQASANQYAVLLQSWDEVYFDQLNVEHATFSAQDVVGFATCGNVVIDSVHFEAVTMNVNGQAYLHLSGAGSYVIKGLTARGNTLGGSASNPVVNFLGTGTTFLELSGFNEHNNTVTTPAHPFINYGSATNINAIIRGSIASQTTVNTTTANAGCLASFGTAPGGAGLVSYAAGATMTSFGTGGVANLINSTSGSSTVMAAGTWYYAPVFIPYNVTLTGIIACTGSTGATDNWIVALWGPGGGTALANSALAGIVAPAANTKKQFAFTGTVNVQGPSMYWVGVQSNGTTARLLSFSNAVEGFSTGSTGGSFGTVISLTPPGSYTQNIGPFASTY